MLFRLFTNDVGPNRYSALMPARAANQEDANRFALAKAKRLGCKAVALPENRPDLWPDGHTGELPAAAKRLVQE